MSAAKMMRSGALKEKSCACGTCSTPCGRRDKRTRVCLSTLKPNPRRGHTRRMGIEVSGEKVRACGTGLMLKTLLVTSLLGWARCQESQSMTPEERTVIR